MIQIIKSENLYVSKNMNWLKSRFHFSFAEYMNRDNLSIGSLRVINDDLIESGNGFDFHPHSNMEIISYVVNGEQLHQDNLGNSDILDKDTFCYMSAGSGIVHSEMNNSTELLHLYQIWIKPNIINTNPTYQSFKVKSEDKKNRLFKLVGDGGVFNIKQDCNVMVSKINSGVTLTCGNSYSNLYITVIAGSITINGEHKLNVKDSLKSNEIKNLSITADSDDTHILIFDIS